MSATRKKQIFKAMKFLTIKNGKFYRKLMGYSNINVLMIVIRIVFSSIVAIA